MKWSWKIARFADIDVNIHLTFFILIVWVALSYWQAEGTLEAVVYGVSFILALFICVVLHEFGHALTARRYGIKTKHITLLPIGGVASLESMPEDPKQEIAVALAGPAVNLVIAASIWLWLSSTNSMVPLEELSLTGEGFLQKLLLINIILAVFNMLPAFPMDGGRVLRAALAMNMDHNRATQLAARIGQWLALWLGFLGLLYNPFLIVIALFIWIGAAAEANMEQVKTTISGMAVGRAMLSDFQVLSPDEPLSRAIELTLAGSQAEFPVVKDEVMVGVLNQANLLSGLQQQGDTSQVKEYMQKDVQSAEINEPLEAVLKRLQSSKCRLLSVNEDNKLVGIINLDNIMELINIQTALHETDKGHAKWGA
ncbi:MAG: site-2 protease family protein [Cocleimonas sp.]